MLLVSSVTLLPPTPSTTQTRNRTVSADEATTTRRKFRSSPRFFALTVPVSSRWPPVSASWAVAVQRRTGARRVQTIHEQRATFPPPGHEALRSRRGGARFQSPTLPRARALAVHARTGARRVQTIPEQRATFPPPGHEELSSRRGGPIFPSPTLPRSPCCQTLQRRDKGDQDAHVLPGQSCQYHPGDAFSALACQHGRPRTLREPPFAPTATAVRVLGPPSAGRGRRRGGPADLGGRGPRVRARRRPGGRRRGGRGGRPRGRWGAARAERRGHARAVA